MLTLRRFLLAALSAIAVLGSAYAARAPSIELIATPFTGTDTVGADPPERRRRRHRASR